MYVRPKDWNYMVFMAALILLSDQQCTDKTSFGGKGILVHARTVHISPSFINILCHIIMNFAHYNIIRYSGACKDSPYFTIFYQHITTNVFACSLSSIRPNIFYQHITKNVFSCPGQLNRWHCHSLSELTFDFSDTSRH